MDDPVETYLRATVHADVPALLGTLAPGASLSSPLVGGAVFREPEDLGILFGAVYEILRDLRWEEHYRDGRMHTVLGRARVLGAELHDAMLLETDADGRVLTIRPHLRPWTGLSAFAIALAPRLTRHPGVLRRAGRAPTAPPGREKGAIPTQDRD
ncbi:nuclear transport factor 2 family protein [Brachybacterium sp. YJGR34]|uniref:nuclear transport factor 2 family protein n=1 Tax=Brachybacterium sp. YJGR34 TaxID=2059911 RepID=UPI000E0C3C43|nr:nuclear transport factor 2 family protein [Brachybacterium sp. YJGR34]